ncbi:MAG: O-antigen ligase family protein [Geopsychrobacter sp.]|nr:O-antigen ligase family protein [Geopsychrobacter sp.]
MDNDENLTVKMFFLSICAYPVFLPTVRNWGSGMFLALVLLAVYIIVKNKLDLLLGAKKYLYIYLYFVALCLISFLNSSDLGRSWRSFEVILYLAGFFLLRPVIRCLGSRTTDFLLIGLSGCGIVTAMYSVFQPPGHLSGAYHHIFLGEVTALCAAILFAVLLLRRSSLGFSIYYFVGFSCSVYVSVLSGSRGAWLGAFLAILLTLALSWRELFSRRNCMIFTVVFLLLLGVFFVNRSFVISRFHQVAEDIALYKTGSSHQATSIGSRFLMWSIAVDTWKQHPFIGSGLGDFKDDLGRANETGEIPRLPLYSQAHSLYMDSLSGLGSLGTLGMVLFLFLLPAYGFTRCLRSVPEDFRYLAVAGLACLLAFAVFGLTDSWLNKRAMVSFYVVLVAFLWGSCQSVEIKSSEPGV